MSSLMKKTTVAISWKELKEVTILCLPSVIVAVTAAVKLTTPTMNSLENSILFDDGSDRGMLVSMQQLLAEWVQG